MENDIVVYPGQSFAFEGGVADEVPSHILGIKHIEVKFYLGELSS